TWHEGIFSFLAYLGSMDHPALPTGDKNSKPPQPPDPGLTFRSLAAAVLLTLLSGLWVRQSEIVVLSTQITESVPAIPGLAALVFLLFINVLLRRTRLIRPFSRAELLVVFLFVTLSSTVMGIGVMQFLF